MTVGRLTEHWLGAPGFPPPVKLTRPACTLKFRPVEALSHYPYERGTTDRLPTRSDVPLADAGGSAPSAAGSRRGMDTVPRADARRRFGRAHQKKLARLDHQSRLARATHEWTDQSHRQRRARFHAGQTQHKWSEQGSLPGAQRHRSEKHTSELPPPAEISY